MAEAVWTTTAAGKKQDDILGREKTSPTSPVSGSHQTSSAGKMSPPKDSYWFAHAAEPRGKIRQVPKASPVEKDESLAQEQVSPSHKPYMDKQSDLQLEGVSPVEKLYVPPRAATPSRLDSYWFAHSGIDLSSPTADQASDSGFSDGKESSPSSLQRDKKNQVEQDQYFEGKQKQPKQLRTFTAQTDSFQEYESSYRQAKGDHYHDNIKYQANEEKRSYIWDTKMESKEANLKQSFEQEAKIEARRNAQRNHLSFAFGNSTKENLVEDKSTTIGHPSYQGSEVIFPIIQHIDERDIQDAKKNDMSSYNLIQKIDDCMSRSMIITSTARGRRKTDLVPVVPSSRNSFSRMPSPGNQAKRSVSMTRLDQLAQPRRHYVEARQEMGKNASSSGSHSFATSMSKSMYSVDSRVPANKTLLRMSSVSKSMLHLASHQPLSSGNNFLPPNPQLCSASSLKNSKRLSQSMMHLSIMPRPTRASLLRAEALAAARDKGLSSSMLLLSRNDAFGSRLSLAPAARKEPSQSPARPRSSLSAAAEVAPEKNQTLKVTMRSKPKTRPRPVSIAGTVPDQPSRASTPITKDHTKPHKRSEKNVVSTAKPPSAKGTSTAVSKASSQKVPETPVLKEEKEEKEINQSAIPEPDSLPSQPDSVAEVESPVNQNDIVPECNKEDEMSTSFSKSRITSEEEAKAALQEKRRLAREQAEREAELERIRQEEIRRQEEEQRRKEEEEQRRQEEEQLKLMAELQRQEEEKLRKAIEEREKREEEERLKQEEENRLKAEKEEQERIAREEAERQRIELAERLKREEEERAERKRRVEQIMSRTRGKSGNQQSDASSDKSNSSNSSLETAAKLSASGHLPSSVLSALSSIHGGNLIKGNIDSASDNNNIVSKLHSNIQETENNKHQSTVHTDSKRETEISQNSVSADTVRSQEDNVNNMTADVIDQGVTMVTNNVKESDKRVSCDKAGNIDIHHQTNGYSDDNERSSNGLSHGKSESSAKIVHQLPSADVLDSTLEQVIQLEDGTTRKTPVLVDDNLLNNVEDVNSNTMPGAPVVAFEEVRQPQASITG